MPSIEELQQRGAYLAELKKNSYKYNIYRRFDIAKVLESRNIVLSKLKPFGDPEAENFINIGTSIFAANEEFNKYFSPFSKIDVVTFLGKVKSIANLIFYLSYKTPKYILHADNIEDYRKQENVKLVPRKKINNFWLLISVPIITLLTNNEDAARVLKESGDKPIICINNRDKECLNGQSVFSSEENSIFYSAISKHYVDTRLVRYCHILSLLREMLLSNEFTTDGLKEFIDNNLYPNTTLLDGLE